MGMQPSFWMPNRRSSFFDATSIACNNSRDCPYCGIWGVIQAEIFFDCAPTLSLKISGESNGEMDTDRFSDSYPAHVPQRRLGNEREH
jgi:hypothetical protein